MSKIKNNSASKSVLSVIIEEIDRYLAAVLEKDNYDKAVDELSKNSSSRTPKCLSLDLPKEVQDLLDLIKSPRSQARHDKIKQIAFETWCSPDGTAKYVMAYDHLNAIRYVNRYLAEVNRKLDYEGFFICGFDSSDMRRARMFSKHNKIIAWPLFLIDFFWHRVCSKLSLTKKFYYWCTDKVRKVFPHTEVLGRLYYCGFEAVCEGYIHDRYYVVVRKVQSPNLEERTSHGLIIKLPRVGKHENFFQVYKFRTMYAYAEYLQSYVYQHNALDEIGKFKDDYRITGWGCILRKLWIDELPMIINVLKGEMKIVGVRPLSLQYFNLYTPQMRKYRTRCKPGLLPPYYADLPTNLEEIQDSEKRYLDAYFKHCLITQWRYFVKIINNIFIKRVHSK